MRYVRGAAIMPCHKHALPPFPGVRHLSEGIQMPIYEYRCDSCGHELEAMQKFSDEALTDCPCCNQATLKKRISAAGVEHKGSGWYATDFKGGSKKSETKSEGESAPSTDQKKQACGTGGCGCH